MKPTKRQFANFAFYKVDPAWRGLPDGDRARGKAEFIEAVERFRETTLVVPYSLVGIRGDCDFMLWRISYDLDDFRGVVALREPGAQEARVRLPGLVPMFFTTPATVGRTQMREARRKTAAPAPTPP